jgi:large exoprotein involved in heme utilization and adhesion
MPNVPQLGNRTREEFIADASEVFLAALVGSRATHALSVDSRQGVIAGAARLAVQAADALCAALNDYYTLGQADSQRATTAIRVAAALLASHEGAITLYGESLSGVLRQVVFTAIAAAAALLKELGDQL